MACLAAHWSFLAVVDCTVLCVPVCPDSRLFQNTLLRKKKKKGLFERPLPFGTHALFFSFSCFFDLHFFLHQTLKEDTHLPQQCSPSPVLSRQRPPSPARLPPPSPSLPASQTLVFTLPTRRSTLESRVALSSSRVLRSSQRPSPSPSAPRDATSSSPSPTVLPRSPR